MTTRIAMRRLAKCIRKATEEANQDRYRLLADFCDYQPAHYGVQYTAKINGKPFGQSCLMHVGALLADAVRTDSSAVIEDNLSRMTPVIIT